MKRLLLVIGLTYFATAQAEHKTSFHLGFSSDMSISNTTTPTISGVLGLADKLALQLYSGISNTSPFNFAVGSVIKYSVAGDNNKGFHLGGGFGLGLTGATETFFINFIADAGFHFHIIDNVYVAVDGGLTMRVPTGGANKVTVELGGNSPWLFGMSLMYRL